MVKKDLEIRSERMNQIPLIYGLLEQMHVAEIIDEVLPKPWRASCGVPYIYYGRRRSLKFLC